MTSEHFETLHLAGVLPGKEVKIGDSWKIDSEVAQSLCLFDGLISHELMAKFKQADSAMAIVTIDGAAKGLDDGAMANLTVAATVWYDRTKKRIVAVNWKQKDVRDQGPTSPAAEIESTTIVKREPLDRQPDELNATVLASVPATNDPPATMQNLIHRDPRGRFQLLYSRDWHLVGQTDFHLIMRLLDRGDFIAQATLTCWKNACAGQTHDARGVREHGRPRNWLENGAGPGTSGNPDGWQSLGLPHYCPRRVGRRPGHSELLCRRRAHRRSNDRDVHNEAQRRQTTRDARPGHRQRHRFSEEVGQGRHVG